MMYKPLPSYLTIKKSSIHELGLFALENIALGTNLGMSHIKFNGTIFRTPLGGFINHSDEPNCKKVRCHDDSTLNYYNLYTTKAIKSGDELTLNYTLYSIRKLFKVAKNGECPTDTP